MQVIDPAPRAGRLLVAQGPRCHQDAKSTRAPRLSQIYVSRKLHCAPGPWLRHDQSVGSISLCIPDRTAAADTQRHMGPHRGGFLDTHARKARCPRAREQLYSFLHIEGGRRWCGSSASVMPLAEVTNCGLFHVSCKTADAKLVLN